jgi:choline kinase
MGSLALCKDIVADDFLLIEGDTFFEKKVVELLSGIKSGNCMAITEESGSGDECFIETKQGYVTKITKDRHRVCNFEGEMMGVTRIALATYRKLIEAWERSSNPYLNYEYLSLMCLTARIFTLPILYGATWTARMTSGNFRMSHTGRYGEKRILLTEKTCRTISESYSRIKTSQKPKSYQSAE